MKGRFITGIAAGALIGTAASILMVPRMSSKNRRRATRFGKKIMSSTGNIFGGMKNYMH